MQLTYVHCESKYSFLKLSKLQKLKSTITRSFDLRCYLNLLNFHLQNVKTSKRVVSFYSGFWLRAKFLVGCSSSLLFCFDAVCDWFAKLAPPSQPMLNQNKSWLVRMRFPALGRGCVHLRRILIGWLRCLWMLWLATRLKPFALL